MPTILLLKRPEVERIYGRSCTDLYDEIRLGLFVAPVALGRRSVRWPSDEVDTLVQARIAGKTEEQIRRLVRHLMAERGRRAAHLLPEVAA